MTSHFIVIGNPIAHSKSPQIHHAFAQQLGLDIHYGRQYCPDDPEAFVAVVQAFFAGGGVGANVTVPFKQVAYQLCQQAGSLSVQAKLAGAVNTLYQQHDTLMGYNTDGEGLINHLQRLGFSTNWQAADAVRVAIIGAGGACRGIILPLLQAGVSHITIANRTVAKAETLIDDLQTQAARTNDDIATLFADAQLSACGIDELDGHYDLIINATSIGLTGDKLPLAAGLTADYAYDMIYGRPLPFLQHFADQGAKVSDGLGMLIGQAALSFEQWTGQMPNVTAIDFASSLKSD